MARIGNETKLILKLAEQRHKELRDQRNQTPNKDYREGYERCFSDIWEILTRIVADIEG